MRTFFLAVGAVLALVTLGDFAVSHAADERSHARMAAEARCLDTNTAALPAVQAMCAERAAREIPEP